MCVYSVFTVPSSCFDSSYLCFWLSHYILLFKIVFRDTTSWHTSSAETFHWIFWPSCKAWWNPPLLFTGCLDSCQPHCMPVTTTNRVLFGSCCQHCGFGLLTRADPGSKCWLLWSELEQVKMYWLVNSIHKHTLYTTKTVEWSILAVVILQMFLAPNVFKFFCLYILV